MTFSAIYFSLINQDTVVKVDRQIIFLTPVPYKYGSERIGEVSRSPKLVLNWSENG